MFQQFQLFPNVFVLRIQHCVDCHGSRVQGEGEQGAGREFKDYKHKDLGIKLLPPLLSISHVIEQQTV